MMTLNSRLVELAAIAICLLAAAPSDAVEFTPLGHLPSFRTGSWASAISGDGNVVVGFGYSGNGDEAFRWTRESGMLGLGELPGGRVESVANAVSFDGSVIVGDSHTEDGWLGFRWTELEGMAPIAPAVGPNTRRAESAVDVSADGNVITGVASTGHAGTTAPYRLEQGNGLTDLGLELGGSGWDFGLGSAISPDGSTIYAEMVMFGGANVPYRWEESTGYTLLTEASHFARVHDVSNDQSVVVGANPFDHPYAFRWTEESDFQHLSQIVESPDVLGDFASAVSGDGALIVGYIANRFDPFTEDQIAAIWDETRGWRAIRQILGDSGIDVQEWNLTSAVDISDDGRYIVGNGINPDGDDEAWLVDLSNPTPLPGDYNANNIVDQGDLDLVLLNWGSPDLTMFDPPEGWIRNLPSGLVDQAELDAVLLNWGTTQPQAPTAAGVPEPATVLLVLIALHPVFYSSARRRDVQGPKSR